MPRITPCLWFDDHAEEAMKFYVSIFRNSKEGSVTRYGETGPGPKGSVMTATFTLDGQEFMALNGGPTFKITPAISFIVNCKTQKEIDTYWEKLSTGGKKVQCGWLTDKFGVSWQIVPTMLARLVSGKDPAQSDRVMKAVLKMVKLDIRKLKQAAGKLRSSP